MPVDLFADPDSLSLSDKIEHGVMMGYVMKIQATARRYLQRLKIYKLVSNRYEKILDPRNKKYYYYDILKDESSWQKPKLLLKFDLEVSPTYTKDQGALLIQKFFWGLASLRRVRVLFKETVIATHDEKSGDTYFFNPNSGMTYWELPKFMRGKLDWKYDNRRGNGDDAEASNAKEDSDSDGSGESLNSEQKREKKRSKRKYPRSKSQFVVDKAVDFIKETRVIDLSNCGAVRCSSRIYDINLLERLDISNNKFDRISNEISYLSNLQEINANNNLLTKIPKEFGELAKLKRLYLSNNQLSDFYGTFYKNNKLEVLHLAYNKFVELPLEVGNLELLKELHEWEVGLGQLVSLQYLDISHNSLLKWPVQMERLQSLRILRLEHNIIDEIPETIGDNVCLSFLDASWNALKSISGKIFGHPLTELYLNNNQLPELPPFENPAKAPMRGLTKLNISNNRIGKLNNMLASFIMVKEFDASHNCIACIHQSIGTMSSLVTLNLSYNKIAGIPGEFAKCKLIIELNLCNNQLTSLPLGISSMKGLKLLVASNNDIVEADERIFADKPNLEMLNLHNNRLARAPLTLFALKKLKILNLSYNKLVTVDVHMRDMCETLVYMNLSNNMITRISDSITTLTCLTYLGLECNRLTKIPESIGTMVNLTHINLRMNDLDAAPVQLLTLPRLLHWSISWSQRVIAFSPPIDIIDDKFIDNQHEVYAQCNPFIEASGTLFRLLEEAGTQLSLTTAAVKTKFERNLRTYDLVPFNESEWKVNPKYRPARLVRNPLKIAALPPKKSKFALSASSSSSASSFLRLAGGGGGSSIDLNTDGSGDEPPSLKISINPLNDFIEWHCSIYNFFLENIRSGDSAVVRDGVAMSNMVNQVTALTADLSSAHSVIIRKFMQQLSYQYKGITREFKRKCKQLSSVKQSILSASPNYPNYNCAFHRLDSLPNAKWLNSVDLGVSYNQCIRNYEMLCHEMHTMAMKEFSIAVRKELYTLFKNHNKGTDERIAMLKKANIVLSEANSNFEPLDIDGIFPETKNIKENFFNSDAEVSQLPYYIKISHFITKNSVLLPYALDVYAGLATAILRRADCLSYAIRSIEKDIVKGDAKYVSKLNFADRHHEDFDDLCSDKMGKLKKVMEQQAKAAEFVSISNKKRNKIAYLMFLAADITENLNIDQVGEKKEEEVKKEEEGPKKKKKKKNIKSGCDKHGKDDGGLATADAMDGKEGTTSATIKNNPKDIKKAEFEQLKAKRRAEEEAFNAKRSPPPTDPSIAVVGSTSCCTTDSGAPLYIVENPKTLNEQLSMKEKYATVELLVKYRELSHLVSFFVLDYAITILRLIGFDPLNSYQVIEDEFKIVIKTAVRIYWARARYHQGVCLYMKAVDDYYSVLSLSKGKFRPCLPEICKCYIAAGEYPLAIDLILTLIPKEMTYRGESITSTSLLYEEVIGDLFKRPNPQPNKIRTHTFSNRLLAYFTMFCASSMENIVKTDYMSFDQTMKYTVGMDGLLTVNELDPPEVKTGYKFWKVEKALAEKRRDEEARAKKMAKSQEMAEVTARVASAAEEYLALVEENRETMVGFNPAPLFEILAPTPKVNPKALKTKSGGI